MRRTAPLLIAVFAPSVAHAAVCSPANGAALVTCLANAGTGDVIQLTANTDYFNASGFLVQDSITIQQNPVGGTNPRLKATGTGANSSTTLTIATGNTLTLRDVTLQNDTSASYNKPIIDISSNAALIGEDLQFEAHTTTTAAAGIEVRDDGKLTLTNTLFNGALINTAGATNPGGAAIQGLARTTIDLTNVTAAITSSSTGRGGFLAVGTGSTVAIRSSTVSNWTSYRGGALYGNGATSFSVVNTKFDTDKAADGSTTNDDGGCIAIDAGSISITGSTFKDCDAGDDGGAVAVFDGSVIIADTTVNSNHAAGDAGAIYIERGGLDADRLTSTSNDANANGGSILMRGGALVRTATIDGSSFSKDKADNGGAVYLEASNLTVGTTTFSGTKSDDGAGGGDGGAIYARASDLVLTGTTFTTTTCKGDGGAIFADTLTVNTVSLDSDVNITTSTFDTTHADGVGGSLFVHKGDSIVASSTFLDTTSGSDGGAMFADTSYVDIDSTTFTTTTATGDGGAIFVVNTPLVGTIDTTAFASCKAAHGGAIASDNGDLVLTTVNFLTDTSTSDGGAAYVFAASTLTTNATHFISNKAAGKGGAIYAEENSSVTVDGGTMDKNVAGTGGGAIRSTSSNLTVRNGTSFTANEATTGDGGAISLYAFINSNWSALDHTYAITQASFHNNQSKAAQGGAVALNGWGPLRITTSDFVGNYAKTNGGAVYLLPDDDAKNAGTQEISNSIFRSNNADASGGAIYANGSATTADSFTFNDNMLASNTGNIGGGLWIDLTTSVNVGRNTICDNWANTNSGGGIHIGSTIDTTSNTRAVTNNFFVENRAKVKGGGIFVGDKDVPVTNNLFLTNKADGANEGGGLWLDSDGAVVRNNLFLGAVAGDGVRLPAITNTKDENNGYANNVTNSRWVNSAAVAPIAPSFVFTTAPEFFSYNIGTPGDTAGCDKADFRMWMWPDTSQAAYPAPATKDAGATGYTDLDASKNDIGPFGGPGASADWWTDHDGDGAVWVYDCNDGDKTVFPGAPELCNLIDDDCDKLIDDNATLGVWYKDSDSDGYGVTASSLSQCAQPAGYVAKGGDCDDGISGGAINPGALEKCSTVGVDDDCNGAIDEATAIGAGTWYADTDADSYGNASSSSKACIQPANTTVLASATDCDDKVFTTNPGASEICNTVDDDCDKQVDESATDAKSWYPDSDKDNHGDATVPVTKSCVAPGGYLASNDDCNDKVATTFLGAPETCNGVDDDCDVAIDEGLTTYSWFVDGDLDSYGSGAATVNCAAPGAGWTKQSGDCNDALATINPGVLDNTCNSVDDNCSGKVDEAAVFSDWYEDKDADKYGTTVTLNACAQPVGYASGKGDCNDAIATINPGAIETCNLVDDDCNTLVDDNVVQYKFYQDTDGDGYGGTAFKTDCKAPAGYVIAGGDCNDASKAINPGAAELCNDSVDQNCDNDLNKDAIDAPAWYADTDRDGQGDPSAFVMSCDAVAGRVATGKDCDDKDATILDGVNWYGDGDGDKYGNINDLAYQCAAPSGYLADATDCNDANALINPNAGERCATAGIDDDCDKLADDLDPQGVSDGTLFYFDSDNDTYGAKDALTLPSGTRSACLRPPGYAVNKLDCDDTTALNRPGASEQCDGVDNNCNGIADDNVSFNPYWADADGDGFGDATAPTVINCKAPVGYIDNDTDCNDTKSGVNPNAPEQCATPGVDDDCDGQFDESDAIDQTAYYLDEDGDDWSILADEIVACEQPPNHSTQLGDCDDLEIAVNPQADELCDGIDNDCNGRVDEGLGAQTVYTDADEDGFGDEATAVVVCRPPASGESGVGGDCDDIDETINPAAVEIWYDGVDQDCKGDDDDDQDGDGVPIGEGPSDDCDDQDPTTFPDAVDVPDDGIDQDCDGMDDPIIPDSDRPFETDLTETGIVDVPGEACGCATPTSPTWSLAALVAAFAGWRRARRSGTAR